MKTTSLTLNLPGWAAPRHLPVMVVPAEGASRRAAEAPAGAAADPDLELTRRAQGGDSEAFRTLVERHRDRAFTLALRIVRSRDDAEEVAQDAFVRAWRALPGFRGEARFGTWLHSIVARRAFDRAATLKQRRGRESSLDDAPEPVARPAGDAEAARRSRRLEALMSELSDAQRAAVTLYYHEDQSVERVAEVMRLPVNTVKTHLSRARAVLRAAWQRSEAEA